MKGDEEGEEEKDLELELNLAGLMMECGPKRGGLDHDHGRDQ